MKNQKPSASSMQACEAPAVGRIRQYAAQPAIVFPTGGVSVDVSTRSAVNVLCRVLEPSIGQVKARCYAQGGPIPAAPVNFGPDNDGYTILTENVALPLRFRGNVPVFRTDIGAGAANNDVVAYSYDNNTGGWTQIPNIGSFRAVTQLTQTCAVSAKCSVWFAWVPDNVGGPFGESPAENRAVRIAVPVNAATLTITADASGWTSGVYLTDANGFGPAVSLVNPLHYQNASFMSGAIEDAVLDTGSLIYMLADEPDVPAAQVPTVAGVGPTVIDFAVTPRRKWLFLAFHDVENWYNNDLSIQARLTWTV